jgi:hypothetical protein
MADIFDQLAPDSGDVFDQVAGAQPKTFGGFVSNIGTSAKEYVKGVAHTLNPMNLPETISNVSGVIEGGLNRGAEKLAGAVGLPNKLSPHEEAQAQKFDAVAGQYKQRYGSPQKAIDTLYRDPVGAASDLSVVAGGAGGVLKASGLARTAKTVNAVSQASNPIVGIPRAIGKVVPLETRNAMAQRLYQSGLKPPTGMLSEADESRMIQTAMDERIPLPFVGTSEKALTQTRGKIDAIDAQSKGTIAAGAAAGKTVDPNMVVGYTSRSYNKFKHQANPRADLDAIGKSGREFIETQGGDLSRGVPAKPIPVDKAQKIKQGTYSKLRDSYGELTGAAKEAQKDLARGLKEEIYDQFPELRELGKKEKALIDLEESLERFAKRQGNRDLVGIGTPITGGAVGAMTGNATVSGVATLTKAAIDNPGVKSRIAIALRASARRGRTPARVRQAINAVAAVPGIPSPTPLEQ